MKITKRQLRRIIKEEKQAILKEAFLPNLSSAPLPMKSRAIPEFAAALKGSMLKEDPGQLDFDIYENVWTMIDNLAIDFALDMEDPYTVMEIIGGLEKIIRELKDNSRGSTR